VAPVKARPAVAEKLRLEEVSGDGARVDRDERFLTPPLSEWMSWATILARPFRPDHDGNRLAKT